MRLVDTHCHLNDTQAFPLAQVAVSEALEAGVSRLVVVGIDTESSRKAVELANEFAEVFAVVGWHPNHAHQYRKSELIELERLLAHPKVVALGEIGLDFYRDHASVADQHQCLQDQLGLAAELNVPVVFHCRDAYNELLEVLESRPPHKYLFHCFAGDAVHAQRAVKLDCWFGVDGPVTYSSANTLRSIIAELPRDRIVIETDAPWMTPVPYRGQRNRPAWVTYVNQALAEVLSLAPEECADLTTANACSFFGPLGLGS